MNEFETYMEECFEECFEVWVEEMEKYAETIGEEGLW